MSDTNQDNPNTPAAQAVTRPRLWQFKNKAHFRQEWTSNELIDARHEKDLRMSGAYPAIDVEVCK